jgi:hypothetical protein
MDIRSDTRNGVRQRRVFVECALQRIEERDDIAGPLLRPRAAVLDHRTPVLALALEPNAEINVRKERLVASGLDHGPMKDDERV